MGPTPLLLAALLLVSPSFADTILLGGGLTLHGIVLEHPDQVEVGVPAGVFSYRRDVVRRIDRHDGPLHEYERRRARGDPPQSFTSNTRAGAQVPTSFARLAGHASTAPPHPDLRR